MNTSHIPQLVHGNMYQLYPTISLYCIVGLLKFPQFVIKLSKLTLRTVADRDRYNCRCKGKQELYSP